MKLTKDTLILSSWEGGVQTDYTIGDLDTAMQNQILKNEKIVEILKAVLGEDEE